MAHVHDTHGHGSTTVVSDREGPATALIVLIAVAALALMIWFFAFSGVVFDRDSGGTDTGPTINNEQTDTTDNTNTEPGDSVPDPTNTGG
ncbi:MAG: hypothetical protein ACRDJ1_07825 [Actinomycetota bacterium]